MQLLILIPYYLVPAGIALALVAWGGGRIPFQASTRRVVLAVLVGLAVAPVLAMDGYGGGIVPIWLYLTLPSMKASVPIAAASWIATALIALAVMYRLDRNGA